MNRLWSVVLSLAFVIGAIQTAPAQEPIKIGVVGPHSGPAAYDGQSNLIGAQVAAEEINQAGGLLGGR
ncbi:MAG TPA: ABC transporter substrate-binding protein, partial [Verrucomicrobiae bacterium]|nr:ABC transporter substrate-binding protein [Verrucomicrobiae bacterium]